MPFLSFEFEQVEDGPEYAVVRVPVGPHTRELTMWWLSTAARDVVQTVPKAIEYGGKIGRDGAADLRIMGDTIATLLRWGTFSPVALEMACWFYVLGKVGRLVSDYQHQWPGKGDTWLDITVYSMMARRIQEAGRWP
jgi:hypothetical protein